jgi:hypothetical protein
MKVNTVVVMDFGEANCEEDNWIELAEDHIQWLAFVYMVLGFCTRLF